MNAIEKIYNNIKEAEERFNDLMKREYPDFYKAGYKFYTNELVRRKEDCIDRLKSQGLDFVIGEKAFNICENEISPTCIPIFIKKV